MFDAGAARAAPFRIWGPDGIRKPMDGIDAGYEADVRMRMAEGKLPRAGLAIAATAFERESIARI